MISAYEQDPNRAGITDKTRQEDRRVFAILREVLGGETPIKDVRRADCRRFQELILELPRNAQQLFPGMSARRAAEEARRQSLARLSPKGANKYLNKLAALFNFAEAEQMVETNPARRIALKGASQKMGNRNPFSSDQLALVFSSPTFFEGAALRLRVGQAGGFWVPLISLFMGLRLGEACQLEARDFDETEGVQFIRVEEDEHPSGKRVKTEAGNRTVPIHPQLIRLGLLELIEGSRSCHSERVFPEIARGETTTFSPFSKSFSRYLRSVGAYTRKTTFHSLRHSFRDALRTAEVPDEVAERLGGWKREGQGTASKYGSLDGYSLRNLHGHISRVEFPAVPISRYAEKAASPLPLSRRTRRTVTRAQALE